MSKYLITLANPAESDKAAQKLLELGFKVDKYYKKDCLLLYEVSDNMNLIINRLYMSRLHWRSIKLVEAKLDITIAGRPIVGEQVVWRSGVFSVEETKSTGHFLLVDADNLRPATRMTAKTMAIYFEFGILCFARKAPHTTDNVQFLDEWFNEPTITPVKYHRIKAEDKIFFLNGMVLETFKNKIKQPFFDIKYMFKMSDIVFDTKENKLIKYRIHPQGSNGWQHMEDMLVAENNTFEFTTTLEKL
jgi:hypothetical protein